MITGVLGVSAIVSVIALIALMIGRKDLVGVDLGARSLLRLYLYIGSLAGVLLVVIGLAALIDYGAAQVFGVQAIYGQQPYGGIDPSTGVNYAQQYADQARLNSQMDVLRGVTFMVFGALFWGGHWFARRSFGEADEGSSVLRRAYNVMGTFVFGVGTVVLLPFGIYIALSQAVLTPNEDVYMQGFGDSLAGGIVSLAVWIYFLFSVIRALPRKAATPALATAGARA